MSAFALTGQDVIQINSRSIVNLADADSILEEYQNDISKVKTAKNGNVIAALDNQGLMATVTLRLLIGSSDDKFLNSIWQTFIADAGTFVVMTGYFAKRVGDGGGNLANVIYQCSAGFPKKLPGAKSNADGDLEQSVSVWSINFGTAIRTVQ
jgi:hypothetical protein